MKTTTTEITRLLQLQKIDIDHLRLSKKLEDLPQRNIILRLREKTTEIKAKDDHLENMLKESRQSLNRIRDEDERLVLKQASIQQKIDEAHGDYRAITSLTKDLEGASKRRKTLKDELNESEEKNLQLQEAKAKIEEALSSLKAQEDESIVSFQQEGGALKNEIARLEALRTSILTEISDPLIELYEKKRIRCSGVALSKLEAGVCSVCRNNFDEGKLFHLKAEAPLSECPSCKRMMVILDD